mmetsp:Transcript_102744/g.329441  ORF Transcript_102744/g.329441 Transcript_102744/m.329441 type:complete len:80 (-) Transcript_102744:110-349(-)
MLFRMFQAIDGGDASQPRARGRPVPGGALDLRRPGGERAWELASTLSLSGRRAPAEEKEPATLTVAEHPPFGGDARGES